MHHMDTPFGPLRLQREPPAGNSPLQAWDAADLQLLSALRNQQPEARRVLVINDAFGALALGAALASNEAAPAATIYSWGDSFVAHRAAHSNALASGLPPPLCLPSSEPLRQSSGDPLTVDAVLWRIPKSLPLLADQIAALRQGLDPAVPIHIGAMQKHVPQRAVPMLERHLGTVQRQRLQGKAIIWRAGIDPALPVPDIAAATLRMVDPELILESDPAVFNAGRLDAGSALLLAQRAAWPQAQHAADLGCGSGVLGLTLAAMRPEVSLWGFDESYQAIASARRNAHRNSTVQPEQRLRFTAAHLFDDALPGQTATPLPRFELILCNPPFHQQHVVGDHIAWLMFQASKARLAPGGELWIVGNRHLGYHHKLKRLFGNCQLVASDARFVVLRCRR